MSKHNSHVLIQALLLCAYTSFVIVVGATFKEGYVGFNPINLTTFNKGASNGWPCQWISIGC